MLEGDVIQHLKCPLRPDTAWLRRHRKVVGDLRPLNLPLAIISFQISSMLCQMKDSNSFWLLRVNRVLHHSASFSFWSSSAKKSR